MILCPRPLPALPRLHCAAGDDIYLNKRGDAQHAARPYWRAGGVCAIVYAALVLALPARLTLCTTDMHMLLPYILPHETNRHFLPKGRTTKRRRPVAAEGRCLLRVYRAALHYLYIFVQPYNIRIHLLYHRLFCLVAAVMLACCERPRPGRQFTARVFCHHLRWRQPEPHATSRCRASFAHRLDCCPCPCVTLLFPALPAYI